jgi:hypothetical protein
MAKFELKFIDKTDENCNARIIQVNNEIAIVINNEDNKNIYESLCIVLDKSTAIKFAKTLRTEINKIKESEGQDGNR